MESWKQEIGTGLEALAAKAEVESHCPTGKRDRGDLGYITRGKCCEEFDDIIFKEGAWKHVWTHHHGGWRRAHLPAFVPQAKPMSQKERELRKCGRRCVVVYRAVLCYSVGERSCGARTTLNESLHFQEIIEYNRSTHGAETEPRASPPPLPCRAPLGVRPLLGPKAVRRQSGVSPQPTACLCIGLRTRRTWHIRRDGRPRAARRPVAAHKAASGLHFVGLCGCN